MIKVATPILYESSLDELNRIRPLRLADKSRFSFDYPVLCSNPVNSNRPAISKLARCDKQGSLVKNVGNSYKNAETINIYEQDYYPLPYYTFSRKVSSCLLTITHITYQDMFAWTDNEYDNWFVTYRYAGNYFLSFTGQTIYFYPQFVEGWYISGKLTGFY